MKQVIPFYKEIVFKNTIANLTSISLEHKETVLDGEVSGEFIIFGDYKVHNDTTEKEEFKYKLPFTALIPDDVDPSTVVVDIANFTYEQIDNDVLRIDIDFSIEGECLEVEEVTDRIDEIETFDEDIDKEIDEILNITTAEEEILEDVEEQEELILEQDLDEEREDTMNEIMLPNENVVVEVKESIVKEEIKEEYVTYHIHVVGNTDSIESIIKLYNTNLDILNEYNDIKDLKVGDKVLIPEYLDE